MSGWLLQIDQYVHAPVGRAHRIRDCGTKRDFDCNRLEQRDGAGAMLEGIHHAGLDFRVNLNAF